MAQDLSLKPHIMYEGFMGCYYITHSLYISRIISFRTRGGSSTAQAAGCVKKLVKLQHPVKLGFYRIEAENNQILF